MSVFISILVVVVILGVLATIHELGHFWVARLLKIKAYEVSIFVGPALVNWRRNGVDYSIRAIPLGAYVRFTDIDEEGRSIDSDDPELLINAPRWKRLIVSLAGPMMNLILGVIIFTIFFCTSPFCTLKMASTFEGTQLSSTAYQAGDYLYAINGEKTVTYYDALNILYFDDETEEMVLTFKSAETGDKYDVTLKPEVENRIMLGITHTVDTDNKYDGWLITDVFKMHNKGNPILKPGDYLVSIDEISVTDEEQLTKYLQGLSDGDVVSMEYVRNGEYFTSDCTMSAMDVANSRGIYFQAIEVSSASDVWLAFKNACQMPLSVFSSTKLVIKSAFAGEVEAYNVVSGPVGVVNAVDEVVADVDTDVGFKATTLLMLAGYISLALTITNMLPLPGLDGSQLIMLIVEMVIGHKLSKKAENVIAVVGFICLIGLVLLAFSSDIAKIVIEGW